MAFRDISPQAPVHILVIPKARIPMLSKATDEDSAILGHLLTVARKVADQEKLDKGNKISYYTLEGLLNPKIEKK